jgi:hypothetical protein
VCGGDEEFDVAFVMFQRFWPTVARGEVFDCAELAHDSDVLRAIERMNDDSYAALDGRWYQE